MDISSLGVASMQLKRKGSADTLAFKHVELPGPLRISETTPLVDHYEKSGILYTSESTIPQRIIETYPMKEQSTSFLSIPDTVLSTISNKADSETRAWKEVPSVLRATIKQILLVLQEHSQHLSSKQSVHPFPPLNTASSLESIEEFKALQSKFVALERAHHQEQEKWQYILQSQIEKFQMEAHARETAWMQRFQALEEQLNRQTEFFKTQLESPLFRSQTESDSESYVKWETLSERVREVEVRLVSLEKKFVSPSLQSGYEKLKTLEPRLCKTEESLQMVMESLKSNTNAQVQDERLLDLTHRVESVFKQCAAMNIRSLANEEALLQLNKKIPQKNDSQFSNSEEWHTLKSQMQILLSSHHELKSISSSLIPNLQLQTERLRSDQTQIRDNLEKSMTGLKEKQHELIQKIEHLFDTGKSDTTLMEWQQHVSRQLSQKLDALTLENLMPHLVTREQFKLYLKKQSSIMKQVPSNWKDLPNLIYYIEHQLRQFQTEWQAWQVRQESLESTNKQEGTLLTRQDVEVWKQAWTQDMDEKMYLMASELRDMKSLYSQLPLPTNQILDSIPKWNVFTWHKSQLKHGSAMVWKLNHPNNLDWIRWEEQQPHVITFQHQGMYLFSFAIFTTLKPSIQIVINGESIMSAIHSPTYTVHHENSSKSKKSSPSTGISLIDFIHVPAMSKLSLHWHGAKTDPKVEGLLYIQKIA